MILGNSYRIDLKTTWSIQINNPSALGLLFPWMAQLRTRPARRLQKAFRKAWWTSRRTQRLQRWLDHRTWGCIGWSLFSWYMIYIMLRIRGLMQKSLGSPVQIHPYLFYFPWPACGGSGELLTSPGEKATIRSEADPKAWSKEIRWCLLQVPCIKWI